MTLATARLALCLVACAACVGGVGCAGLGLFDPSAPRPGPVRTATGQSLSPQAAVEKIVIGKSSKADVCSALGTATVISFESGYEVWVYRWAAADRTTRAASELVVLFEPSGLASKVRVRPGYATHN
jgi:hypothetical protein